ncbi:MAG: acylphosphatase [Betaproteobacteria bacterium]|nr:acylphosphatase [Betaproteobacteria bacterium]
MRVIRQLQIRGLVQGVGSRDALRREALALGCTGWVRNRHDGSVEALVAGNAAAVDAVIARSHRGPTAAHVSGVVVETASASQDPGSPSFDRLPTA